MEKKKTALTEENPGGDSRYSASDAVHQAGQQAQSHAESKPVYSSAWQQRLDQAMEKILNREPFQYDLNGDALYRRYRDQAVKDGRMAMVDTMGQASAMTGGYASSYAQTAGQQSYQQRLDALADRVPELYAAARESDDRQAARDQTLYETLLGRENQDYSRYQDTLSNWQRESSQLWDRYQTERDFDYQAFRNLMADQQWQEEFREAQRQFNEEMRRRFGW